VEAVRTRARHEMVRLERGLIILEVIVGIAPLLGLIGAVSGLVHVFSHLGLSSGASDTRQIALGHCRSIECHRVRAFNCRADIDRVHLFFEKSGSDVH